MSLGPPFDESGERLVLGTGAACSVALLAAVAISLLASDRTLGESFRLHVLVRSPGNLHTGAQVRMAGQQIGEVMAIRGTGWLAAGGAQRGVEIEARILRSWRRYIYHNSAIFAHSPNVLTEASLEIAGPPRGAAPGPVVADGDSVRGADPAEVDQLLAKVHHSLIVVLAVSRELDPQWQDFMKAVRGLVETAGSVAGDGQITRVAAQAGRAYHAGLRLRDALEQADALPRTQALVHELNAAITDLRPELRILAEQAGQVQGQLEGVTRTFGPDERRKLEQGVAAFRAAIAHLDRLGADAQALLGMIERGEGTLGGMVNDVELFDEWKETSRILKQQSWRVLIKRPDHGQRQVR